MSTNGSGNSDLYLKIGLALAIQGEAEGELGATLTSISPGQLGLELSRPTLRLPFQAGEKVGIRYWDKGAIVYSWDAEVVDTSGLRKQRVEVSIDRGVVVQRRKSCRVCVPIFFSFTVIGAAESQLISKKVLKGATQNISAGGLAFETSLPFKIGDQLALNFHLSSSSNFDTRGWVVRSRPAENRGDDLQSIALMFQQREAKEQERLVKFLAR
jgi:c-di-GMP-binding flagellar brake protein YcgR